MGITLVLPGSLKDWLSGSTEAECKGSTVEECIDHLDSRYPGFKKKLVDDKGNLSADILIFVNGENIRDKKDLATPVEDGDAIGIIPLAAGG